MVDTGIHISGQTTIRDLRALIASLPVNTFTIVPPEEDPDAPEFAIFVVQGKLPTTYVRAAVEVANAMLLQDLGGVPA